VAFGQIEKDDHRVVVAKLYQAEGMSSTILGFGVIYVELADLEAGAEWLGY